MPPGDTFTVRLVVPSAWTEKCVLIMSFPSATTFSWVEPPVVQNASAPVMFMMMPVTFPAGTFGLPRSKPAPCRLVRLTLVPRFGGTLKVYLEERPVCEDSEPVEVEAVMAVLVLVVVELVLEVVVVELEAVTLDEYFRVRLVTLMRRYLRVAFWGGGSAR